MHARRSALAALFAAALIAASANAATVKVGFVAVFTGPEALTGEQLYKGFELYLKTHPNVPGGHKIEVLKRDTAGPAPDRAKRLTQELIARDKVDLVTGIMFSSEGFAMMDVCREAKFPMLILIAGANGMTDACPYAVRVSFGMWQAGYPMGEYAATKLGVKTAAVASKTSRPARVSSSPTEGWRMPQKEQKSEWSGICRWQFAHSMRGRTPPCGFNLCPGPGRRMKRLRPAHLRPRPRVGAGASRSAARGAE